MRIWHSGLWLIAFATPLASCSAGVEFRDPDTGVSLTLPPRWTWERVERSNRLKIWRLHDPQSEITVAMEWQLAPELPNYPDGVERAMRGAVDSRTKTRQREGLEDYRLRDASIQSLAIGGLPAMKWQADYMKNGRPMVESFFRVRGRKTTVLFYARMAADEFSPFQARFASVLATLRLPGESGEFARTPVSHSSAIAWRPIIWHSWNERERGALYVPVRLDGIPGNFIMQLDTGAGNSPLDGDPRQFDRSFSGTLVEKGSVPLSGEIAGCRFDESFHLYSGGKLRPDEKGNISIGSLGADFLRQRILLIDFAGQRVAILPPGSDIPPEMESAAQFLRCPSAGMATCSFRFPSTVRRIASSFMTRGRASRHWRRCVPGGRS